MRRSDSVGHWAGGQGRVDTTQISNRKVYFGFTKTYTAVVTISCVVWGGAGALDAGVAGTELEAT